MSFSLLSLVPDPGTVVFMSTEAPDRAQTIRPLPASINALFTKTAERVRPLYLAPFLLAGGIGTYFALPHEPGFAVTGTLLCAAFFLTMTRIANFPIPRLRSIGAALLVFVIGFAAAQFRTDLVSAPVLLKETGPREIEGRVIDIEYQDGEAARVTLDRLRIERLKGGDTPERIRVKFHTLSEAAHAGQKWRFLGNVNPPSPPVVPGGFDFQRYAWFKRIGGFGYAYRAPEIISPSLERGVFFETARQKIAERIRVHLGGMEGAVFVALATGERGEIPAGVQDDLRDAGIAHILAISGLHVGLMSGIAFFALRFLLAAIPGLALRYPIKKWAAVAGILAAAGYTFLVGAGIPTLRALMMCAAVYTAVLLDRSPISLRLVAVAAVLILLIFPESLLSASFQMSFAAVGALVAFYERTRAWWADRYRAGGWAGRFILFFASLLATSFIAGLATMPFAAYHFNRLSLMGLAGNILAMPILTTFVMPAVFVNYLAMVFPDPVQGLVLQAGGAGISLILKSADWVAGLPYARLYVLAIPGAAFALMSFVLALAVMLRSARAAIAALCLFIAACLMMKLFQPLLLVSSSGAQIAYRDDDANLHLLNRVNDRFAIGIWSERHAYGRSPLRWDRMEEEEGSRLFCDPDACRAVVGAENVKVSYLRHSYALETECAWADVIVSDRRVPEWICTHPKIRLDRKTLKESGSVIVTKNLDVRSVSEVRGTRPWTGVNRR